MDEQVHWVTNAEAARELDMSLSTLDRKIRRGEIEVRREGRRVYVRMEGPEYVNDDELLRRSFAREDKLQRTLCKLDGRASELEREEAKETASASRQAYEETEVAYRKERAADERTRRLAIRLGLVAVASLIICGLATWQLFT